MRRPVLLDLFCGAGGAAVGYHRAGFRVVGVDNRPQPNYPFRFIQADALTFDFDFDPQVIHASPPRQQFTRLKHVREAQGRTTKALDLVNDTRERLESLGIPWVMENVPGAPLQDPVQVCGSWFGLGVRRHRLFESPWVPYGTGCRHAEQGQPVGVWGRAGDHIPAGGTTAGDVAAGKAAMGVDWPMTWSELKEAIPPCYTHHVGLQLRELFQ